MRRWECSDERDHGVPVWSKYTQTIIYLPRIVETFPDHTVDNDPSQQEKAEEVCLYLSNFIDPFTDMQNFVAVILERIKNQNKW